MMISPEEYYETELKDRTQRELLSRILQLQQQMIYLKSCMENPYHRMELVHPDEATQLAMTREYLAVAKKAYTEAGGQYREGMSEYLAAKFLEKLPDLEKITFYIGGFFGGRSLYEIKIADGGFRLTGVHYPEEQPLPVDNREIILEDGTEIRTAEDLFDYFREMHMGEWLPDYAPERFGYSVCDGTQWELKFEYGKGHNPWESGGSNSYPWNFADLCRLFGELDPTEVFEEDEEDEPEYQEYLYCLVTPEDMNRSFHYISEITDIAPGETVVIPYGAENKELFGTVVSVEVCDEWSAPFPVEKTKKILRRATDEELRRLRERELEKYTYCWVEPEGNDKGNYYISELEDIRKGDMVMIPYGYDNREVFGKVVSVRRTSEKNAPYPQESTKRILRKLVPDQNRG